MNGFEVQAGYNVPGLFNIKKEGTTVSLETDFGVIVEFDGDAKAVVKVPAIYRNDVTFTLLIL